MNDTRALLHQYTAHGSEAAFRELVTRYVNLVYGTALRRLDGDQALAQDAAQAVFIDLARQAAHLSSGVLLGGWLHQRACHVAATLARGERRRRNREKIAMELHTLHDDAASDLAGIAPILDEAIQRLGEEDRVAIVLRFFEQRDFRSVGEALGTKEDAARMRVNRALEKLHQILGQQGWSSSTVALGALLTAAGAAAAPAGMAAGLAATALASAGVTSVSVTILPGVLMTKLKAAVLSTLLVGAVATPLILQQRALARLRAENQEVRAETARLAAENTRLAELMNRASTNQSDARQQQSELIKLRGEVASLRRQKAEATQAAQAARPLRPVATEATQEAAADFQQQGRVKMGYAKNWMIAFFMYADKNQEQVPNDLQAAAAFLPENTKEETTQAAHQFEILYQGSLTAISNPGSAIVLREAKPFQGPTGAWYRTYGYADGHSEIHRSDNGDFEAWEKEHVPILGSKAGGLETSPAH